MLAETACKRGAEDKKYAVIMGTRPEIIKLYPVVRELMRRQADLVIVHTGQHYSYEMDRVFFEDLDMPEPDYRLNVGLRARTHAEQTGLMMIEVERVLMKERPDFVIVQGDTNTTLAGALAARKLGFTRVAHVEAGLRSRNWEMPEETNRVVADHISDFLFAPTPEAKKNLLAEGVPEDRIFVVGNTIVDAVHYALEAASLRGPVLDKLGLSRDRYFLLTLHRAENVDHPDRLRSILEGVRLVREAFGDYDVVFPVHPRTRFRVREYGLEDYLEGIKVIEPLGYLDFLTLEANARLVMTDSGGVQEEACVLRVPTVTLRTETERPETVYVGANMVVGRDPGSILNGVKTMMSRDRHWENPFGSEVAKKIVDILGSSC